MSMLLKTEDLQSLREIHLVEIDGQYLVMYRNSDSYVSKAMDQHDALCLYEGLVMALALGEAEEEIIKRLQ